MRLTRRGWECWLAAHAPAKPVEVINAGFAACYSPDTYYLYLKTEGLALAPDAIVVGIFVGNDLDSQFAFENEWLEKDGSGLPARIRNIDTQVVNNYLLPQTHSVPLPGARAEPIDHVFQALFDIWWEMAPAAKAWLPSSVAATVYAEAQAGPEERVPYIYRQHYAERDRSRPTDRVPRPCWLQCINSRRRPTLQSISW